MKHLSMYLLILLIAGSVMAGSTFVSISDPVVYYTPKAVQMSCPFCGDCYPRGGDFGMTTAMYCGRGGCCNTTTYEYACRITDSAFSKGINECDWIEWGKWEAVPDTVYPTNCLRRDFQPFPCDSVVGDSVYWKDGDMFKHPCWKNGL